MDLINTKVKHKIFGEGVIIANENSYLEVRFDDDVKKFVYPQAFDGYLTIENKDIGKKIKQEIDIIKKNEKEHLLKIEARKRIQRLYREKRVKVRKKTRSQANVAFKCSYCDGGKTDENIGFDGVCSKSIIKNNIEIEKDKLCCANDCACGDYLKGKIKRSELEKIHNKGELGCYESKLLKDWKAFVGVVQSGMKKGQPMKLSKVKNNSLCILTTRLPNATESERIIFGVFLVDGRDDSSSQDDGFVATKSKYRIKLTPVEAEKMLFWNYHSNEKRPEVALWSSRAHRYFQDEQAVQILQDIVKLKKGTKDESLAKEFLLYFARISNIIISNVPEKNGALKRQ